MKTTDVRSRWSLRRTLIAAIFAVSLAVLPTGARAQQPGLTDVSSRLTELTQRLSVKPVDGGAVEESRGFGVELLGAARFEEAARLFAAFRLAAPDDPAGFYGGALALFNLHRLDDAQTLARAAIEKGLAAARLRQPTSVNSTTAATRTFGNAPDSLVLLGVVLAVKGDDAGALTAVSRAVSLAPDNFDAQFALGRARYGANDPAGAARAFAAASALKPRDEQTRFFLASALESAGDDAGALAAYRELVTLAPGLAEGHLGVGVLLVKRAGDDLSEGIRELEKALAIKEGLYEGQVTLGRALIRKGRIAEAVKPLQHAAKLAPNNPEPHYQLAIAYRRLGNKESADAESALVKKINAARRSSPVARSDESAPVKRP